MDFKFFVFIFLGSLFAFSLISALSTTFSNNNLCVFSNTSSFVFRNVTVVVADFNQCPSAKFFDGFLDKNKTIFINKNNFFGESLTLKHEYCHYELTQNNNELLQNKLFQELFCYVKMWFI